MLLCFFVLVHSSSGALGTPSKLANPTFPKVMLTHTDTHTHARTHARTPKMRGPAISTAVAYQLAEELVSCLNCCSHPSGTYNP